MKKERKLIMKKAAAVSLSLMLSLAFFGGAGTADDSQSVSVISGYADENSSSDEDYEKQLAELEAKKKALDEKIASAGDDIKGEQEKLDAVNEKAKTIQAKIDAVSEKTAELEDELCELDDKMRETQYLLEQSEQQIAESIEAFKGRLRAMYIAGNTTYSDVIVNAEDFYDVLMRVELVKRVSDHDNQTIQELLEQKAQIEEYQAQLDEESAELKEKSAAYAEQQIELAEQKSELAELQRKYGDAIDDLRGDLDDYQSQLDEVDDEYDKVSEAAESAAAAETTAKTTKNTSSKSNASEEDSSSEESGSSESDVSSVKTETTTTAAVSSETETKRTEETSENASSKDTSAETTTTAAAETEKTASAAVEEESTENASDETENVSDSSRDEKIATVISYAKSMVGGRYVWGGSSFGATDCSGLTMLSYAQIGVTLPHKASSQANYGTSVSLSDIQPGDLVFFGNGSSYSSIYHVAIYVGDGKIVHAESSATGIVISYLSSVSKYNHVTCIKRII